MGDYEVSTAVKNQVEAFWVVMPRHDRFGETCCIHLQGALFNCQIAPDGAINRLLLTADARF